jgi:hypothetical protein
LELNYCSDEKIQNLCQQLYADPKLVLKQYHHKVASINVLLKQTLVSLQEEPRSFSPRLVKIVAKLILKEMSEKEISLSNNVNEKKSDEYRNINDISLLDFFTSCRISLADAERYVASFVTLGFDDLQSIQEDIPFSTLESVLRPGHLKRIMKALEHLKNPKIQSESENLTENQRIDSIEHEPTIIPEVSHSIKDSMEIKDSAEFSSITVFFIREVGRGASGIVYKSFSRASLSTYAVKHVSIPTSDKRKAIFNELNILRKVIFNLNISIHS